MKLSAQATSNPNLLLSTSMIITDSASSSELMHSPMQILHPAHRCCFDLDAAQASASRKRILARAADEGWLLLPAHFPGHSAAAIRATTGENEFAIAQWADLPRATRVAAHGHPHVAQP